MSAAESPFIVNGRVTPQHAQLVLRIVGGMETRRDASVCVVFVQPAGEDHVDTNMVAFCSEADLVAAAMHILERVAGSKDTCGCDACRGIATTLRTATATLEKLSDEGPSH